MQQDAQQDAAGLVDDWAGTDLFSRFSPPELDRGALVYFWQQADSVGQYLLAILKALVWPAFLVYEVFQGLLG
jgi:hypothetical protein